MRLIKVKVFVESLTAHTSQFFTGLYMLQEQGVVNVSLQQGRYASDALIRLQVNEIPVYIDLADHANINVDEYERCAFYFKRMLLKTDAACQQKLRPYGLNYAVYHKGDYTITRSLYSGNTRHVVRSFLRATPFMANLVNMDLGHHIARVHHFEQEASFLTDPKVIFSAKLWKPEKVKLSEKKQQRLAINQQRIAIVREAKKRLGASFTGGINIDEYAAEVAADALVDNTGFSKRKSYLQLLKNCSIGIANAGLEDSIGFKLAEYVCMSKAVVTSPINQYLLPGDFAENKNYLSFNNTAEECVHKCLELLQNESLRHEMMQNNREYYRHYLHPAKLVMNILTAITSS
ncbi:MAG: hypothetical protein M3040_18150 [Bacteroidota bacterium]|nr:hypothetical protein [Bacteroidota bacterium]